ncbi:MAG: preprotein translocase subunit YajC [Nitrospirae bacterium]|nr:preprotein translocase subunit YajC [Nitrospirota bacterium]
MIDTLANWLTASAWAQAAPAAASGPAGGLLSLVPFLLIFVLFYVLMILPQQRQRKKHQQMLDALKKGDRVVTTGGLIGAVTNIHNDVVTVQVAENVKVKVLRSAVASLRTDDDGGNG